MIAKNENNVIKTYWEILWKQKNNSTMQVVWTCAVCVFAGYRGYIYRVIFLKLFTDGVPHVVVMVDSVESNVIIVNFQQPIDWGWVVSDDLLWKSIKSWWIKKGPSFWINQFLLEDKKTVYEEKSSHLYIFNSYIHIYSYILFLLFNCAEASIWHPIAWFKSKNYFIIILDLLKINGKWLYTVPFYSCSSTPETCRLEEQGIELSILINRQPP